MSIPSNGGRAWSSMTSMLHTVSLRSSISHSKGHMARVPLAGPSQAASRSFSRSAVQNDDEGSSYERMGRFGNVTESDGSYGSSSSQSRGGGSMAGGLADGLAGSLSIRPRSTRTLEKRFPSGRIYAPDDLNLEKIYRPAPRRKDPSMGPGRKEAEQTDVMAKLGLHPGHPSLHDDSYKNPVLLGTYTSGMGKILPRRLTGLSRRSQREVGKAIRRARAMGLMPVMSKLNPRYWRTS